jgi:hypothetical protein
MMFLPLFPSASYFMDNGVNNEGDSTTDDNDDNGDGAIDDDVDEGWRQQRCDGRRQRQWRDGRR